MLSRLAKAIKRGFRGIGKKGYTLVEVAAVVAVTGTLAAVAMPVILDKVAGSKVVAAQVEVQTIKDSILYFMKDTGLPPFYNVAASTLPVLSDPITVYYPVLWTEDGINPPQTTGYGWTYPDLSAYPTSSIDSQLNDNGPKYPTKSINAWKGPYLPSTSQNKIKKDPWGNRYFVSIAGLTEDKTSGVKYQRAVFVLSAGPNGTIETKCTQLVRVIEGDAGTGQASQVAFVLGGDDIIARIF